MKCKGPHKFKKHVWLNYDCDKMEKEITKQIADVVISEEATKKHWVWGMDSYAEQFKACIIKALRRYEEELEDLFTEVILKDGTHIWVIRRSDLEKTRSG